MICTYDADTKPVWSIKAITTGRRYIPTIERSTKRAKMVSSTTSQGNDSFIGHTARNELDTRADTICVGINWKLLSTTGQCCNVHGFHDDFDVIEDVPVVRAATTIQDENGGIFILIVNEALYFGPSLDHSLVNPNQIRHYGIQVSDNPFDSTTLFGIDHEDLFIPFKTEEAAVFLNQSSQLMRRLRLILILC